MIHLLADVAADMPPGWANLATQGGVALATIGTLVWAIGKIVSAGERFWKQISDAQREMMDSTVAGLKEIANDIRRAESARTDTALLNIKGSVEVLNEITKAQATGLTILQGSNKDMRDSIHAAKNATQELIAAKMELERK